MQRAYNWPLKKLCYSFLWISSVLLSFSCHITCFVLRLHSRMSPAAVAIHTLSCSGRSSTPTTQPLPSSGKNSVRATSLDTFIQKGQWLTNYTSPHWDFSRVRTIGIFHPTAVTQSITQLQKAFRKKTTCKYLSLLIHRKPWRSSYGKNDRIKRENPFMETNNTQLPICPANHLLISFPYFTAVSTLTGVWAVLKVSHCS